MSKGVSKFKGERLARARESREITRTSLAGMVDLSPAAISQYEKGQRYPSSGILRKIAGSLNFPMHYFLKEGGEEICNAVFFRSMSSATKIARLSARRRFEWLLDIVRYFRRFVNFPEVNFPCFASDLASITVEDIEVAANRTRKDWGLGLGPIGNVTRVLENNGGIVVRQELNAKTLDAFSSWYEEYTPTPYFVLGVEKMCAVRSRFDAAHELGHMVLHRNIDDRRLRDSALFKEVERQANYFAGAFLLPRETFPEEVGFAPSLDMLVALKSKWRVSIAAMVKRLRHLHLISEEREHRLFINMGRRRWRTEEPLDNELEIEEPELLEEVLGVLFAEKIVDERRLTIDLGLRTEDIERTMGLRKVLINRGGRVIRFPETSERANRS